MKHLSLLIAVIFCISNSLSVNANENIITQNLIVEKNQQMEDTLQKRDPKATITFLHNNICDNATFNIQVNNPTLDVSQANQSFQMNKVDYINSFITGMHYVDQYDVSIETTNINISSDKKTATVIEVMTEEGVILNAQNLNNPGMPFLSTTTCTTTYKINAGQMQSDQAFCKTQTGAINTI
jgi:hypothetical protein